MSCFDTLLIPCAWCSESIEVQTKAGPCHLEEYPLPEASPAQKADVAGEHTCSKCKRVTVIDVQAIATTRRG